MKPRLVARSRKRAFAEWFFTVGVTPPLVRDLKLTDLDLRVGAHDGALGEELPEGVHLVAVRRGGLLDLA